MAVRFGADGRLQSVAPGTSKLAGSKLGEAIRRSGGGGGSSDDRREAAKAAARAKAAAKASALNKAVLAKVARIKAQELALIEARRQAKNKLSSSLRRRSLETQSRLINKGAQEVIRNLRNKAGERVRTSTVQMKGTRVFTVRNLDTGEFTVREFKRGRRISDTTSTGGAKFAPKPTVSGTRAPKITKAQLEQANRTFRKDSRNFTQDFGTFTNINATIKKDIKLDKISNKLVNIADIVTGGKITEGSINSDQAKLNKRVIEFNTKFSGKELSESQFQKAEAEQKFIDSEQKRINSRNDKLATSRRNKINTFVTNLDVRKQKRLTTVEKNRIEKARNDNKKLQDKLKRLAPEINKAQSVIKEKEKEIAKINAKGKNMSTSDFFKRIRLNNQINTIETNIAITEERAPPRILAGTVPISGVSAPSGITKIKFLGSQKVGKDGKILTDVFFKTNKGSTGVAKGIRGVIGKDGKTVELVVGRSGKIAVNFPTATKKLIKTQTFISLEEVSSKTKAINTVVALTKSGKVSVTKAKKLKALIVKTFKGDVSKVSLKKLQATIGKVKKLRSINLKRNLLRLKRKGLISVNKAKGIGKRTSRRRIIKKRIGRVPKRISPKKIARRFIEKNKIVREVETITKQDFINRIKSLRRVGDISKKIEKSLIKKINKLSKKGKIPKSEFIKIASKIKKPTQLKTSRIIRLTDATRISKLDLQKNIAILRKRGLITKTKSKALKSLLKTKRPKKLLNLRKNLIRLRKRGIVSKSPRSTAKQPGFGKIIKRLRNEALRAEKSGRMNRATQNFKVLEQRGIGKSMSVKGKKFFRPEIRAPSGKLVKKVVKAVSKDDFTSVSSVLTKDDLSLIIGKSITRGKDKSKFIGLIKGSSKVSDSSFGSLQSKQQFGKALTKVLTKVSSAIAKAEKTEGLKSKSAQLAGAAALLSSASLSSAQKSVVKAGVAKLGRQKAIVVSKQRLTNKRIAVLKRSKRRIINKQKILNRTISKNKSKAKQLSKNKSKVKSISRLKINQRIAQLQKSKIALANKQRLITQQITQAPAINIPSATRFILPPRVKRKKVKRRSTKSTSQPAFNVFGKSRGKFVKLNPKPLSRSDALSKGAFAIDRTTARTFKIVPAGKKKKLGKLLKGERNYFNRQGFKLREVRIRRGRKFKLKQKYIEKSRHAIDTKSEKSGLSIAKLLRQRRKSQVTKKKRKITPSQRKELLKRLKKARRVRMKNLKGGNRK